MKKVFFLLFAAGLFAACNNDKKSGSGDDNKSDTTQTAVNTAPQPNVFEKLIGSFVGAFGDNKITLLISKINGDTVTGRSIVGGNDRPFSGIASLKDGIFNVAAKEPGDHKDDGAFNFTVQENNTDIVTGSWKPNDAKRPAKDYTLQRKEFKYRIDVGAYPEASQRLLKEEDVENMYKQDLEFMRNEIFARHGFCFNKKDIRQRFELAEWYIPNTVDIKGQLTEIEKKNIALIKRYEKYAEEYGDEYGR